MALAPRSSSTEFEPEEDTRCPSAVGVCDPSYKHSHACLCYPLPTRKTIPRKLAGLRWRGGWSAVLLTEASKPRQCDAVETCVDRVHWGRGCLRLQPARHRRHLVCIGREGSHPRARCSDRQAEVVAQHSRKDEVADKPWPHLLAEQGRQRRTPHLRCRQCTTGDRRADRQEY